MGLRQGGHQGCTRLPWLDPPSPGFAAYHCQQAAEKTMKGLLIAAGRGFRKIHDLDELADLVCPLYPTLSGDLDLCRPLTSWVTDYRYPPADLSVPPPVATITATIAILERLLAAIPAMRP